MSLNNSINTAWQITARCQTLRSKRSRYQKQNDKCTDVMNCIHTQSRTFRFFTASSSIPTTVAATPILFNCSTWSFIVATRARQTRMIVERAPSVPFIEDITHGKSWKIKLFPKPVGRQRHRPLTIFFMQSFCSSWRHSTWGKSFSVLFIVDLNTASSLSVVLECCQIENLS